MDTPIVDFVERYAASGGVRLHMPGHKGKPFLGCEALDITEIKGADALYEAEGIIAQSEANAAALFGTGRTLYSTEGSSQCIRAMLYLALTCRAKGAAPVIVAARNVHKAFVYAAALLDFEVVWLWPEESRSLCACPVTAEALERTLKSLSAPPAAVYVTSPDYLGNMQDIAALAETAHRNDTILAVDNAHGAYLHFLTAHPMDLGADICCDSAHKTLPCLTGTGYLHIAEGDKYGFSSQAVHAMSMFGSTSPSYLLMQSLDLCNVYLAEQIKEDLKSLASKVGNVVSCMEALGIPNHSKEPTKITADLRSFDLSREEISAHFRSFGLEFEYADGEFVVFMASPQNGDRDFEKLKEAFAALPLKKRTDSAVPSLIPRGKQVMSIRKAVFSPMEEIPVDAALGRICAAPTVSCPPAIPIAVSGEEIGEAHMALFRHYGMERVWVVK